VRTVDRDDVEALALDAGQDLADQLAAHAVGLDEDESAFSHGAGAYRRLLGAREVRLTGANKPSRSVASRPVGGPSDSF